MKPGVKHYMLNNKEEVNKLPIRPGQLITSRENQILLDMDDGRRHPLGVQMGTQDLVDGESDLATGVLYVVMGEGGGTPGGGGSAPSIKVDSELSTTSTNPVQNKVITSEIDNIYNNIYDLDNDIYYLEDYVYSLEVDTELSESSVNPVQNKVITKKLNEVFQSVSDGKKRIASAITDKGIETSADASFEEMAASILSIDTDKKGSDYVTLSTSIIDRYNDYAYATKEV